MMPRWPEHLQANRTIFPVNTHSLGLRIDVFIDHPRSNSILDACLYF